MALGCEPQLDPTKEEVVKAIEYIVSRAREKKIVAGIHTGSTGNAQKMIRQGFRFVTVSTDVRLLVDKVSEVLETMGRGSFAAKANSAQRGPY